MSRAVEKCKLCGEPVELRRSHIVPRWTHLRVMSFDPGATNQVLLGGGSAVLKDRQYREPMLGDCCEARMKKWEDYFGSICLQTDDSFPAFSMVRLLPILSPAPGALADASSLDCAALARFAVSVLWRAGVSTTFPEEFSTIDAHKIPGLTEYLKDDGAPFPDSARLVAELFDLRDDTARPDRGVVLPYGGVTETGIEVYRFGMFGFWFHLFSGADLDLVNEVSLPSTGRVYLTNGEVALRGAAHRLQNDVPRGKLATLRKR